MSTPPGHMRWFGLYFAAPDHNFQLRFRARLHAPSQDEQHGFGVCVRCTLTDGTPDGPAMQYDPAFSGMRLLHYPHDFDPQTYEAEPMPVDHAWHAWNMRVDGAHWTAMLDGLPILDSESAAGPGEGVFLRVWNGSVSLWDIEVDTI